MPDIQPGLVHTINKDRCGNCGMLRSAHVEDACLFDFTSFREESVNDHLNCTCETVSELADPVIGKDGTLSVNGLIHPKKPLSYITMSFTV